MLDSSFDPVVRELNKEYAEEVERKSRLEEELESEELSEDRKKKLKAKLHDLDLEIMNKQEKLRSRL